MVRKKLHYMPYNLRESIKEESSSIIFCEMIEPLRKAHKDNPNATGARRENIMFGTCWQVIRRRVNDRIWKEVVLPFKNHQNIERTALFHEEHKHFVLDEEDFSFRDLFVSGVAPSFWAEYGNKAILVHEDASPLSDDSISTDEQSNTLHNMLETVAPLLSKSQATALRLRIFDGASTHPVVAEIMGVSVDAANQALRKARNKLELLLQDPQMLSAARATLQRS